MTDKNTERFDSALYALPYGIASVLRALPQSVKNEVQEIRLRANRPLTLTYKLKPALVNKNLGICYEVNDGVLMVSAADVYDTVKALCNNSIYSHVGEMKQGFITMRDGHRAGVAGNFSGESVYDFTSVNIRIARQIFGAADFLYNKYSSGGILIAGPPASGKTTVLRDFIRQASNGGKRVAVVDTRGEISACHGGTIHNDLGLNTDVLYGIEKSRGIELALRTLCPEIIAFDEIGTLAELESVAQCISGGADVIMTAHIGKVSEIAARPLTRKIISGRYVKRVAVLSIGGEPQIFSRRELEGCLL